MQKHTRAVQRMSGDDQGLLARQRSRLPQQHVGDSDLADVVQQGAVLHAVQFRVAQVERARQLTAKVRTWLDARRYADSVRRPCWPEVRASRGRGR